jgi:hypothetical protein
MHVLLHDDLGCLTLRRLRPWHRVLARSWAARLDRELADGMSPEASATLAARAMRLTSTDFRRDLAASLHRVLAIAARPPRIPPRRDRVSQSAPLLAALASRLVEPGPVPVPGVAMVSRLLADGTGPLYCAACRDHLGAIIKQATQALTC